MLLQLAHEIDAMPQTQNNRGVVCTRRSLCPKPFSWVIIIKPVREFLHHGDGKHGTLRSWVIFGRPGRNERLSRVSCTYESTTTGSKPHGLARGNTALCRSSLAKVMGFLPLRQAFGEFCCKALCNEVISAWCEVGWPP